MVDTRWQQLADILVNYSTRVKKGDRVLITMMEVETFPLVRAVYAAAVEAGGLPFVEFQSAYLERDLMKLGSGEQIDWVNEMQTTGMEWADVYVGLRGARNPGEFFDIDAGTLSAHKKSMGRISAMRTELTRWVLVRVPNESFAQQASTSLDEMMNFFFNATIRNWEKEAARWREINKVFQAANQHGCLGINGNLLRIQSDVSKGQVLFPAVALGDPAFRLSVGSHFPDIVTVVDENGLVPIRPSCGTIGRGWFGPIVVLPVESDIQIFGKVDCDPGFHIINEPVSALEPEDVFAEGGETCSTVTEKMLLDQFFLPGFGIHHVDVVKSSIV